MATSAARGAAERLTLAAIVDAADELVAADGFDGLSMRKLAKACDVGVMTLYGYVRTKDDLLAALAERAIGDLDLPAGPGADWSYRVAATFHALRRALLEHPNLVAVVAAGRPDILRTASCAEAVGAALRDTGLEERQVDDAVNALTSFTMGACQREIGRSARGAGHSAVPDFEAEFAAGLDLLITGLRGWADDR